MTAITTVALDSRRVGYPAGRPRSQEDCYRKGALQLGITPSEYAAKREAGLRWCFGHQAWQPAGEFGSHKRMRDGIDTRCRESSRAYNREYQRRKRDRENQNRQRRTA